MSDAEHVQLQRPGTRLKMVCLKLEQAHGSTGGTVRLSPVTSWGGKENAEFWKLTPSGTFEFFSINEDAYRQFKLGEEYYVGISLVPELDRLLAEHAYVWEQHEKIMADLKGVGPAPGSLQAQTLGELEKRIMSIEPRLHELGVPMAKLGKPPA
ncbi:MAG: hypothetical protein ACREB9_02700 [Thermoplasmata archaeon]